MNNISTDSEHPWSPHSETYFALFLLKEKEMGGIRIVMKFVPKNMGVAGGIFFLSGVALEKSMGVILPPSPVVTNVCTK